MCLTVADEYVVITAVEARADPVPLVGTALVASVCLPACLIVVVPNVVMMAVEAPVVPVLHMRFAPNEGATAIPPICQIGPCPIV